MIKARRYKQTNDGESEVRPLLVGVSAKGLLTITSIINPCFKKQSPESQSERGSVV